MTLRASRRRPPADRHLLAAARSRSPVRARRLSPGVLLLLLLLLLLGLPAGCESRAASGPPPGAGQAVPRATAAATSPAAGELRPAPGGTEGFGQACANDRHCPGYLRCQGRSCGIPPAMRGDGPAVGPTVLFDLGGNREAAFRVELAIEPFEQMRGLMFRPTMDPRWGMLFLYDHDEDHSFWMRNTLIPLDMVFLAADGTVAGVVEQAEPLTLEPRSCGRPSRHVLELVGGTVHRLGIHAGVAYRFVNFPAGALPASGPGAEGGR